MREIKFRGYAVEEMINSQWLYGFGVMDIDYVDGTEEWHLHTLNGVYQVETKSIGQYTGLKDKNGTEIYEGDVIKSKHKQVGKVYWCEEKSTYLIYWFDEEYNTFLQVAKDGEVIGNIHEHSNLLKR